MSTRIHVSSGWKYLRWPNRCVVCGKDAADKYSYSVKTNVTGLSFKILYWEMSYKPDYFAYPVCLFHKYTTGAIRILMVASLLPAFISLVAAIIDFSISKIFAIIFFVCLSFTLYWLQPARIRNVELHRATIILRNENYAREFMAVNGLQ